MKNYEKDYLRREVISLGSMKYKKNQIITSLELEEYKKQTIGKYCDTLLGDEAQ